MTLLERAVARELAENAVRGLSGGRRASFLEDGSLSRKEVSAPGSLSFSAGSAELKVSVEIVELGAGFEQELGVVLFHSGGSTEQLEANFLSELNAATCGTLVRVSRGCGTAMLAGLEDEEELRRYVSNRV
jgi:hypothetical protein